jgi:hypothetical protein
MLLQIQALSEVLPRQLRSSLMTMDLHGAPLLFELGPREYHYIVSFPSQFCVDELTHGNVRVSIEWHFDVMPTVH